MKLQKNAARKLLMHHSTMGLHPASIQIGKESMEQPTTTQPTKSNNLFPILIAGGAIVLLAVVGFTLVRSQGQSTDTMMATSPSPATNAMETTTPTTTTASPATTDESMTTTTTVKVVNVEAGSFYYNPKEIRVKKGEKVKIVLTSKDMMHDFVIDELKVRAPITKAGTTSTVEFTATQAGTFEYYCSVANHRQRGQVGKLIVE